jgi:DNA-binding transcriptional ArsR family regulator
MPSSAVNANRPIGHGTERDQLILDRLARIEHKVDSLGQTHAFSVRTDGKLLDKVKTIFNGSKRKAQVYLAANGERAVKEIADHLGMQRQNVGAILKALSDENLLEMFASGGRDLWYKAPIDKPVGVSRLLMREFALTDDGEPSKRKTKKK